MSRRENGQAPPRADHVCQIPAWLRRAVLALAVLACLNTVGLGLGAVYIYQQHLYVIGRGEFRDAEADRLEQEAAERSRRTVCDMSDTFPEDTPSLDRLRDKYGCGPGIPLSELTPDERRRITERDVAPPATGPDRLNQFRRPPTTD